jgi:phage FluMu protein Com
MSIHTISIVEFRARLKDQGVSNYSHYAFKCPLCKTVQSIQSFMCAGTDRETAEKYIGFSCVGRVTDAGSPRKHPDGKPCNWTLGGLLQLHDMEVIDEEGVAHRHFEIATPEEAKALEASHAVPETAGAA